MPSETLTIALPAALAATLRDAVAEGGYASGTDAVVDALTAWTRRHEDRASALNEIRAGIRASIDDPRPTLTLDEVKDHLEAVSKRARARGDGAV